MIKEIAKNIFSVGANDPERRLFDALIPLPDGTTYNSYLIVGSEKTALIDTVDPSASDILSSNIDKANIKNVDYIIANHAEQDHSGAIPVILKKYPSSKVICTEKCKALLINLLHISEERFQTVQDKETISLGDKTLEFIHTPWVHWPETMVTYLQEENILFSCDFFGSHYGTEDLAVPDKNIMEEAAKRYFAEIMMPFRGIIKGNITKISSHKIDVIAPSHGPIYDDPGLIINWYKEWISDDVKNSAIIVYVSMHNSTKSMADYLAASLQKKGIIVHEHDLISADLGKIAVDLVDAATIVVGTPCLLGGIHPSVMNAVYLVNALRPKTRFASIIASYGWGGRIVDEIAPAIKNLKVEILTPVIVKGLPTPDDLKELDSLAEAISQKHKSLNL
jgi:flavorubredoxin